MRRLRALLIATLAVGALALAATTNASAYGPDHVYQLTLSELRQQVVPALHTTGLRPWWLLGLGRARRLEPGGHQRHVRRPVHWLQSSDRDTGRGTARQRLRWSLDHAVERAVPSGDLCGWH